MSIDVAKWAHLGLGFSEEESSGFAELYKNAVVVCAALGGAVLANAAFGWDKAAGKGQGSGSYTLIALLVGAGVGAVTGGLACRAFKLKIQTFLSQCSSTENAIAKTDAKIRKELYEEARKLIAFKDKIEKELQNRQEFGAGQVA